MNAGDYLDLGVRLCAIGVCSYIVVGQVIKPGLRLAAKYHSQPVGKLTKGQEEFYRWLTRSMAVCMGGAMGLLPLWPEWLMSAWGPVLGLVGGGLAPGIYMAVNKALPKAAARLISGAGVRD